MEDKANNRWLQLKISFNNPGVYEVYDNLIVPKKKTKSLGMFIMNLICKYYADERVRNLVDKIDYVLEEEEELKPVSDELTDMFQEYFQFNATQWSAIGLVMENFKDVTDMAQEDIGNIVSKVIEVSKTVSEQTSVSNSATEEEFTEMTESDRKVIGSLQTDVDNVMNKVNSIDKVIEDKLSNKLTPITDSMTTITKSIETLTEKMNGINTTDTALFSEKLTAIAIEVKELKDKMARQEQQMAIQPTVQSVVPQQTVSSVISQPTVQAVVQPIQTVTQPTVQNVVPTVPTVPIVQNVVPTVPTVQSAVPTVQSTIPTIPTVQPVVPTVPTATPVAPMVSDVTTQTVQVVDNTQAETPVAQPTVPLHPNLPSDILAIGNQVLGNNTPTATTGNVVSSFWDDNEDEED